MTGGGQPFFSTWEGHHRFLVIGDVYEAWPLSVWFQSLSHCIWIYLDKELSLWKAKEAQGIDFKWLQTDPVWGRKFHKHIITPWLQRGVSENGGMPCWVYLIFKQTQIINVKPEYLRIIHDNPSTRLPYTPLFDQTHVPFFCGFCPILSSK